MTYDEFTQRFAFDPETDQLGTGGFGNVFKAYDNVRHGLVALKIAPVEPGTEEFSLLREYERVRELEHPNIAFYHACQRLTFPFVGRRDVAWMQYYEAGNLSQLFAQPLRLTAAQKRELLLGILAGIEYLHGLKPESILHRDLKPENILIHRGPRGLVPLITDFGISRTVDAVKSRVSNTVKAFSLHFAAPEQEEGDSLRRNVDLWSFGALVAYIWLDGQLPFRTEGLNLTTASGADQMRRRIRDLDLLPAVATVPAPWQQVLRACLVPDPAQRLKSCAEVRATLAGEPTPPQAAPTHVLPEQYPKQETRVLDNNPPPGSGNPPLPPTNPPAAGATPPSLVAGMGWARRRLVAIWVGVGLLALLLGLWLLRPKPPVETTETTGSAAFPITTTDSAATTATDTAASIP